MSNWNPSSQYRKVAEANRLYYAQTAQMYDLTETCVTDQQVQQALESDIDTILRLINKPLQDVRVLDACGGSGNISIKFMTRGVHVTTCDISSDLLNIFRAKCDKQNVVPEIVQAEIGDYLSSSTDETYDVIVFSSALHHLENIEAILKLSFERLCANGLLFTVFDPTVRQNQLARMIVWLDYMFFKIHRQPNDFVASIERRLRRTLGGMFQQTRYRKNDLEIRNENLGVLAEYHVEDGIDDISLVFQLRQIGFYVIWHHRYPHARYGLSRFLLTLLREATMFKLLLRKQE